MRPTHPGIPRCRMYSHNAGNLGRRSHRTSGTVRQCGAAAFQEVVGPGKYLSLACDDSSLCGLCDRELAHNLLELVVAYQAVLGDCSLLNSSEYGRALFRRDGDAQI